MPELFAPSILCNICSGTAFTESDLRSDGIRISRCDTCGMGVVRYLPAPDLQQLYNDSYYESQTSSALGYGDGYAFIAEHSTAWVSALVRAVSNDGSMVLDIGAADGTMLNLVGPSYRRHAIEVNRSMSLICENMGIRVIANDIFDAQSVAAVEGQMDITTALAIFEHVRDFKQAVQIALSTLTPTGILVFEVPLMTESAADQIWFSTSLEHVWYPSASSIERLFEFFEMHLSGGELRIEDYGSTYVGIASRDAHRATRAYEMLTSTDPTSSQACTLSWLFNIVHGASRRPEYAALLEHVDEAWLRRPFIRRRCADLWSRELTTLEHSRTELQLEAQYSRGLLELQHTQSVNNSELSSLLIEARNQISALETPIDATPAHYSSALDPSNQPQSELQQTQAALDDYAEQLDLVWASTSWRITAPIRMLGNAKRYLSGLSNLAPEVNKRRVKTALDLLVRGDLRTIASRVRIASKMSSRELPAQTLQVVHQDRWPGDLPLVSVVIPCFNYGRYVEDAINSVLRQTAERVEVIVVDGGSSDTETLRTLRALAERQHPSVHFYFREERHLAGDNRNYGIERSQGKYVCCLDADDTINPIYLEMALYLLECHNYDIVSTAIQSFDQSNLVYGVLPYPTVSDMLDANNITTAAVFRRADWVRTGGFVDTGLGEEYVYEDWRLWVRIAATGARIVNIEHPLLNYRVHGAGSLSTTQGVPGMAAHRASIRQANADVVNGDAIALSDHRQATQYQVIDGRANLLPRAEDHHQPTVLLCMPFFLVGGAERLTSNIAEHFKSVGIRLIVITTVRTVPAIDGDASGWFTRATDEVFQLPLLLDESRWEDFISYLVESRSVDVLWLAGSEFVYRILPSLRRHFPSLRVIDLLFNTVGHTRSNRRYAMCIDRVVVENTEVQQWLLDHGEQASRICHIPSGVDVDLPSDISSAPKRTRRTDQLLVGFSGRMSEEKNPLGFVDLACRFAANEPARFVMTGAGPLDKAVRRRIARERISDQLEFKGVVPDIRRHLGTLHTLVLPSTLDGRPVVVLEALALGVPVIASRVGGIPELVEDGINGLLCEPGDVDEFEDKLRWLIGHPRELEKMSTRARSFAVEHLSSKQMLASYTALLKELTSVNTTG